MLKFKKELASLVSLAVKKNKKTAIFIGTTVKKTDFYSSKVRISEHFCYIVAIVFSNKDCINLCKIIDGKVDVVFYDLEKKNTIKSKKITFNLERSVKQFIYKSKIFPYKANDIAIQAAETLIYSFYKKDSRGIGGKKVLIIGCGNIGSKLALKLTECGAKLFCHRRNKKSGKIIVDAINKMKPANTIEKATFVNNFYNFIENSDIIINCSSKVNLIKKNFISCFAKNQFILDIGKGMFAKKALEDLIKINKLVFRLDVTPGFNAFLTNYKSTRNIFERSNFGRNIIGKKTYISVGILGNKNDIVVDNPYKPKKVFGVCDGKGNFIINGK